MTYTPEELTKELEELHRKRTSGQLDFYQVLSEVSECVYRRFGANLWFVEILGRRWSYVAGRHSTSFTPPTHIELNADYGAVTDCWNQIPEEQRNQLLDWLKKLVTQNEDRPSESTA